MQPNHPSVHHHLVTLERVTGRLDTELTRPLNPTSCGESLITTAQRSLSRWTTHNGPTINRISINLTPVSSTNPAYRWLLAKITSGMIISAARGYVLSAKLTRNWRKTTIFVAVIYFALILSTSQAIEFNKKMMMLLCTR